MQEENINEELDLTLQLLHNRTKRNIEVIKNYSPLPPIKCYPGLLNQVFLNILMNSIQALEDRKGEGKIKITTKIDEKLLIEIEDNGCGIGDEQIKKVFQAGFTTKKVGEGTGLGLAISKKIIEEKHQGKLSFKSKLNKGTTFKIEIPVI